MIFIEAIFQFLNLFVLCFDQVLFDLFATNEYKQKFCTAEFRLISKAVLVRFTKDAEHLAQAGSKNPTFKIYSCEPSNQLKLRACLSL